MTKVIKVCHDDDQRNGGKLHGNISRNGYGNTTREKPIHRILAVAWLKKECCC